MTGSAKYVLLCRHGKKPRRGEPPRDGLSADGRREVEAVLDVLKETLARPITPGKQDRVRPGVVLTAPTPEARATARLLRNALPSAVRVVEKDWLCPTRAWETPECGIGCLATLIEMPQPHMDPEANALLVVGHAPQLGWFARDVLKRPYALAHAEVVCIGSPRRGWPASRWRSGWIPWSVSPADEATHQALLKKIQSKMDIAKLFTIVIAFALGVILDQDRIGKATGRDPVDMVLGDVATLLFLLGFALYLATVYAYDQLLMPQRFWTEGRKRSWRAGRWLPSRPPSSSTLILYENMMRIWRWRFTPATICISAVVPLAVAAADPAPWSAVVAAVVALLLAGWVWVFRPMLGTQD